MMESISTSQEVAKSVQESKLELSEHLDVSKVMKEKNAFFVHMIQVTDALNVSDNNKSLDTKKLGVADKLDLIYGTNPSLSASTLRPHTNDGTFMGGFGVLFSHGEIEHAGTNDQDTQAISLKRRYVIGGARKEKEDVDRAIDREHQGDRKSYNEIILKDPEVGGGFMKLDNYMNRVTYEEEESEYYNGEKKVSKIGVLDMTNKVDKFGRLEASYDKPFSVLVEMGKRGKLFVMDGANQIYIVRSIDEKTRRVEFETVPITPQDFSGHYGTEKVNPYAKKEMRERLEKSLQTKGMTLQ